MPPATLIVPGNSLRELEVLGCDLGEYIPFRTGSRTVANLASLSPFLNSLLRRKGKIGNYVFSESETDNEKRSEQSASRRGETVIFKRQCSIQMGGYRTSSFQKLLENYRLHAADWEYPMASLTFTHSAFQGLNNSLILCIGIHKVTSFFRL